MVGNAALRKIICPDPLGAVARADLASTAFGAFVGHSLPLRLVQPRPQNFHRLGAVLVLRFLILLGYDNPAWNMRDPHRAVGRVDMLPSGALRAVGIDTQILFLDVDIHFLGFRQDRDRRRRRMNPPARFRLGHALDPVHAGFILHPRKDTLSGNFRRCFLVPADPGIGEGHRLKAPPPPFRIPLIHAKQIGREKRRLIAAGPGPYFENGILLVSRILGQQQNFQLVFDPGHARPGALQLFFSHLPHVGIAIGGHRLELRNLGLKAALFFDALHDRREFGIFLRQAHILVGVETVAARHQP